jgi:hypothetical protein
VTSIDTSSQAILDRIPSERVDAVPQPSSVEPVVDAELGIEVGILTKGKASLGMVLGSLLLQESVKVRILVVDTSARPVINRDDVRFALRLAADRGIQCSYDYAGESDRAFSSGKARLIRALTGPHLCLMDDDVVMPSLALARLLSTAQRNGVYGYISPYCKNAPNRTGDWGGRPSCTPGSLIYQDERVHQTLLEYYETTVDVLDQRKTDDKVWETAFLSALFEALGRPGVRQHDTITYHLDYREDSYWIDEERTVIARSQAKARELALRTQNPVPRSSRGGGSPKVPRVLDYRSPGWMRRARRVLKLER